MHSPKLQYFFSAIGTEAEIAFKRKNDGYAPTLRPHVLDFWDWVVVADEEELVGSDPIVHDQRGGQLRVRWPENS
jgi:hypothetical protein